MRLFKRLDPIYNFAEIYDPKSGIYIRSNVIDPVTGKETNVEPFLRSYPHLLDVGIMGRCSSVSECPVGCYQQGSGNHLGTNMDFPTFKAIVDESRGKVFSMALGGFGNPNEHPFFESFVAYARMNDITPNYTTSGIVLTPEMVAVTKKYCGAVAVSWHNMHYTTKAINAFLEASVTTNIHYVLGNDTIDDAIRRLEDNDFPKGINAVVFLLYKPVGKVKSDNTLKPSDPRVKKFYELLAQPHDFKVGLDSCHMPGFVNNSKGMNLSASTPCDAGRFSMYITHDGFALPCSFDSTTRRWAVSIKDGIQKVWDGEVFTEFREYHATSCRSCSLQANCFGGCPLMGDKINLCDREERNYAWNKVA